MTPYGQNPTVYDKVGKCLSYTAELFFFFFEAGENCIYCIYWLNTHTQ